VGQSGGRNRWRVDPFGSEVERVVVASRMMAQRNLAAVPAVEIVRQVRFGDGAAFQGMNVKVEKGGIFRSRTI